MTEVRLRARTVSEIVDAAFALYRRDASQYTLLMAIAVTPQLITQIVLRPNGAQLGFATYMIALISFLVSAFTYTIGTAAIMKFGAAVYLGEQADLDATVRRVIPKFGTILWAGFLKGLLYFLGFLFFFVGEFYVAARWFGVTAAIVLEDAGTGEAFSRSTELSSGRKRHILNTLLLIWIIYFLLTGCILFVTALTKSPVISMIAGTAFQVVAYPIFGLTVMLLYYDCRIRSEGFDIEQMAASIGLEPGSAAAGAAR
jgi:hypothetical protein